MNQNFRIAITPLSPIHIGCGEDFEPTSYVVDSAKKRLYCFNPASVFLPESARRQLIEVAKTGSSKTVHAFFYKNMSRYRPYANAIVPMDDESVRTYKKMVNLEDKKNNSQFEIHRVAYILSPEGTSIYIPGSSVKGVIKTALVERINSGRPIEKKQIDKVLGGSFNESPLRFLKIADFPSERRFVETQVRCCKRFYKESPFAQSSVPTYIETIEPWQYRAFLGDFTLIDGSNCDGFLNAYKSISDLMTDLNEYSLKIWRQEVGIYRRADAVWTKSMENLIHSAQNAMTLGKVALIRLGKNTGSESKKVTGGFVTDKKGVPQTKKDAKTLCFASENNGKKEVFGMPFGWAFLEILGGNEELTVLRNLCSSAKKSASEEEMQSEWNAIQADRFEIEKLRIIEEKAEVERKKLAEEEREKEAQREKELQSMTPERRISIELTEKLENTKGKINPGTELFLKVKELLETAVAWESSEDKKFLAEKISPQMKSHSMFQGKHERSLKQLLRELEGK